MVWLGASLAVAAQNVPTPLATTDDAVTSTIREQKPEWTHTTVKPVYENEQVIIQQWVSGERIVKVSIVPHNSHDEASQVIRKFAKNAGKADRLANIGDEAYVWGARQSIVFKRRHFTVYITALAANADDEAAITKDFAKLVVDALDKP
jgi:hypothetical protein